MPDEKEVLANNILGHRQMMDEIENRLCPDIIALVDYMERCIENGGKVMVLGNGGSAADAQHMAAELMGRFKLDRASLPVYALTTNTSIITALANDYDYSQVFKRQLEGITVEGDVVIGISTSGNADNVIEALSCAKAMKAVTYLLTGENGGKAAEVADFSIKVPSGDTARIQEGHIFIIHSLCHLLEARIFGNKTG
ncbi:MAG: SIS domain-containing protein [Chloroflexi bacterium]|nr:SIS domain-containing protein [Chloroflexota bacterium]